MRLVLGVGVRHGQRVVRELGGPLEARPPEGSRHGRIHVRPAHVRGVELVHHARLIAALREVGVGNGVAIHVGQHVSAHGTVPHQAGGIPLVADALDLGRAHRVAVLVRVVLADVVEDGLGEAGFPQRARHRVDVARGLRGSRRVPRLVEDLERQQVRILLQREARVRVHVADELLQVVRLQAAGLRVHAHLGLVVALRKSGRSGVPLGVAGRPPGDRGQQGLDAVVGEAGQQVVQQVQVVVLDQVAPGVAHLPVPHVNAVGVEPETREVQHIRIDGPLAIDPQVSVGPVRVREGGGIVDAEKGDFRAVGGPAHDAPLVHANGHIGGGLLGPQRRVGDQHQAENGQAEEAKGGCQALHSHTRSEPGPETRVQWAS